jgi:preprotein translocase subunit SecD
MNTKLKNTLMFLLIAAIIAFVGYFGAVGSPDFFGTGYEVKPISKLINRGLDLQGGISIVEEVNETTSVSATQMQSDISKTITLLNNRLNPNGVSEIVIAKEGTNRVRIDVPGKFNLDETIATVGKTGKLEFVGPDGVVILTGKDVKKATARYNSTDAKNEIDLELNDSGTKAFAAATEKFLNQQIAINMDGVQLTNPTVQAVISNGQAVITGSKDLAEAQKQADIINSGALPVSLKVVSSKIVGATLGAEALPQSIKAGVIGVVIVMLFMILYYRVPGALACISLIFYMIIVLGTLALINATLTLSGIAGFLLTVGMSVDANILIFERMKEELKSGKSIKSSIDAGFHRAMSSILDSNITAIIAGTVLYMLGSGAVKGFALTLIVGVILSLFTAITFTKFMVKLAAGMGWFSQKWSIGTFGVHDVRRRVK